MKPTVPCMLPCRCIKHAACQSTPARRHVTSCSLQQLRLLHRILRLVLQLGCVTDASESIAPTPPPTVRHDRPPRRTRSTALHAITAAAGTTSIPFLVPSTCHHQPPPPSYRRVLSKVAIGRQRRHCPAPQAHEPHQQTASAAAAAPAMAAPLAPVTPSCILFHSRISPHAAPRCCRQATCCRLLQRPIKVVLALQHTDHPTRSVDGTSQLHIRHRPPHSRTPASAAKREHPHKGSRQFQVGAHCRCQQRR